MPLFMLGLYLQNEQINLGLRTIQYATLSRKVILDIAVVKGCGAIHMHGK